MYLPLYLRDTDEGLAGTKTTPISKTNIHTKRKRRQGTGNSWEEGDAEIVQVDSCVAPLAS